MSCKLCKLAQGNEGFVITICKTCEIPLVVSRYHRVEFTEFEKDMLKKFFNGTRIRWWQQSIKNHAHCHLG